jgi:hypothetical protein
MIRRNALSVAVLAVAATALSGVVSNRAFSNTAPSLDAGTTRTTVRNGVVVRQSWAGIGDHLGVSNTYSGNDFSRSTRGANATTTAHINTRG